MLKALFISSFIWRTKSNIFCIGDKSIVSNSINLLSFEPLPKSTVFKSSNFCKLPSAPSVDFFQEFIAFAFALAIKSIPVMALTKEYTTLAPSVNKCITYSMAGANCAPIARHKFVVLSVNSLSICIYSLTAFLTAVNNVRVPSNDNPTCLILLYTFPNCFTVTLPKSRALFRTFVKALAADKIPRPNLPNMFMDFLLPLLTFVTETPYRSAN